MVEWIPGLEGPFLAEEITTFHIFSSVFLVGGMCTLWFLLSRLFYDEGDREYIEGSNEFFERLRTPVGAVSEDQTLDQRVISRSIGRLCLIYGLFVSLLVLIPNPVSGRLCFLCCGGVMLMAGWLIWHANRAKDAAEIAKASK